MNTAKTDSKRIINRYMINNGLSEMAANAVEVVVDKKTVLLMLFTSQTSHRRIDERLGTRKGLLKLYYFTFART